MGNSVRRLTLLLLVAAMEAVLPTSSLAQVPPHAPGAICATPSFWCWASVPGPVGAPCSCPSSNGYVAGSYI